MPFLALVARISIFARKVFAVHRILLNLPRYIMRAVFRYAARHFGFNIRTKLLTYLKNKVLASSKLRKIFTIFRKIKSKLPRNVVRRIINKVTLKKQRKEFVKRQEKNLLRQKMIDNVRSEGIENFKDLIWRFKAETAYRLYDSAPYELDDFLPRPKRTHKLSRSTIGFSYEKKLREVFKVVWHGNTEEDDISTKKKDNKKNYLFAKFKSSWLKMGIYNLKKRNAVFFMKGNRTQGWYVFPTFPKYIFEEMLNNALNFSFYGAGTIMWSRYWGRWNTIHKRYLWRSDLVGRRTGTPKRRD